MDRLYFLLKFDLVSFIRSLTSPDDRIELMHLDDIFVAFVLVLGFLVLSLFALKGGNEDYESDKTKRPCKRMKRVKRFCPLPTVNEADEDGIEQIEDIAEPHLCLPIDFDRPSLSHPDSLSAIPQIPSVNDTSEEGNASNAVNATEVSDSSNVDNVTVPQLSESPKPDHLPKFGDVSTQDTVPPSHDLSFAIPLSQINSQDTSPEPQTKIIKNINEEYELTVKTDVPPNESDLSADAARQISPKQRTDKKLSPSKCSAKPTTQLGKTSPGPKDNLYVKRTSPSKLSPTKKLGAVVENYTVKSQGVSPKKILSEKKSVSPCKRQPTVPLYPDTTISAKSSTPSPKKSLGQRKIDFDLNIPLGDLGNKASPASTSNKETQDTDPITADEDLNKMKKPISEAPPKCSGVSNKNSNHVTLDDINLWKSSASKERVASKERTLHDFHLSSDSKKSFLQNRYKRVSAPQKPFAYSRPSTNQSAFVLGNTSPKKSVSPDKNPARQRSPIKFLKSSPLKESMDAPDQKHTTSPKKLRGNKHMDLVSPGNLSVQQKLRVKAVSSPYKSILEYIDHKDNKQNTSPRKPQVSKQIDLSGDQKDNTSFYKPLAGEQVDFASGDKLFVPQKSPVETSTDDKQNTLPEQPLIIKQIDLVSPDKTPDLENPESFLESVAPTDDKTPDKTPNLEIATGDSLCTMEDDKHNTPPKKPFISIQIDSVSPDKTKKLETSLELSTAANPSFLEALDLADNKLVKKSRKKARISKKINLFVDKPSMRQGTPAESLQPHSIDDKASPKESWTSKQIDVVLADEPLVPEMAPIPISLIKAHDSSDCKTESSVVTSEKPLTPEKLKCTSPPKDLPASQASQEASTPYQCSQNLISVTPNSPALPEENLGEIPETSFAHVSVVAPNTTTVEEQGTPDGESRPKKKLTVKETAV